MHELSLAAGILELVEQAAEREHFTRVRRLVIEAGALAGVEGEALRFALESMIPGTVLEGAGIEIDEVPAPARCTACGAQAMIDSRMCACPACGQFRLLPCGGTQLRVRELIVQD